MGELRDAIRNKESDGSDLRVAKLISLKVEVGFSTQRVNEKSDRS